VERYLSIEEEIATKKEGEKKRRFKMSQEGRQKKREKQSRTTLRPQNFYALGVLTGCRNSTEKRLSIGSVKGEKLTEKGGISDREPLSPPLPMEHHTFMRKRA